MIHFLKILANSPLVGNSEIRHMKVGRKRGNHQIIRMSNFALMGYIVQYINHLFPRK